MFKRYLLKQILPYLKKYPALLIFGSRQSGKTTLIKEFLKTYKKKFFFGTGDDYDLKNIFYSLSLTKFKNFFQGFDLLVIDEAQKIEKIGEGLKLLVDNFPDLKIIVTGSSSFDLFKKTGEPLTGRKKTLYLYPLSIFEYSRQFNIIEIENKKEEFLIYGSYPKVLSLKNYKDKKDYLLELRDSYLIKDILELGSLKYSKKIFDLLALLAFQIGKEVSLNELSNSLEISKQTIADYLYYLEKSFVIVNVRGFSRNLRKEIYKTSRYYFIDNGIRNAVINNFNFLNYRDDVGELWENFLFIERLKKNHYLQIPVNYYFWRTYDKKEIDLIEEKDGRLYGYEFKWKEKKTKKPEIFLKTYKNSFFKVINNDNYLEFVG